MKTILVFVLSAAVLLALTGCGPNTGLDIPNAAIQFTMPGLNPENGQPADSGSVAGLGTGFFHGVVSVITLFVSFFNPAVQMYEVHNDGGPYNLGFLIGYTLFFGVLAFAVLGLAGGRRRHKEPSVKEPSQKVP